MRNEVATERCKQRLSEWGIPLNQLRIEKRDGDVEICAYFSPTNAVTFSFEDGILKSEMVEFLTEFGVIVVNEGSR